MHDPRPPRSYFGYSQSPAKAQEALKEDEGEVEVEEDEGEERLFELAHEALGQREDEQELRKGQTDGRTDRHRQRDAISGCSAPLRHAGTRGGGVGGGRGRCWLRDVRLCAPGVGQGGPRCPRAAPHLLQPLHVFEVETDVEKT